MNYQEIINAQNLVYAPLGFACTNVLVEPESAEYSACTFELNGKKVIFRVAKITPKKVGQFVTFWKRSGNGPIMPYDSSDHFDFLVVSVRSGEQLGHFVFSHAVLFDHGVLSKDGKGGKRALRVYPPWDITDSVQARKTQEWQQKYFFSIQPVLELNQAVKLFL